MSDIKTIEELGEFGLIDYLTRNFVLQHLQTIKGIGDDAAILDYGQKKVLASTDLLLEGIHFNLMYCPMKHLGYKAAIVNFSDIYAMNGKPLHLLVSLGVSKKFKTEWLDEFYQGVQLACEVYGVDLVGGDTTSSLTGFTIGMTILGEGIPGKIVQRAGAKANELICVTGDLGAAFMGLQLLERERRVFISSGGGQPVLEGYDYVLERQLKPEARKDIVQKLLEAEIVPSSMIDISDGLSSEVMHLCKASAAGCRLYLDKVPIAPETKKAAEEFGIDPMVCALNGGEDYELLFTVPVADFEKVQGIEGISIIGHMTPPEEGSRLVLSDGNTIELTAGGWNGVKE